jgi:hypothetical protein
MQIYASACAILPKCCCFLIDYPMLTSSPTRAAENAVGLLLEVLVRTMDLILSHNKGTYPIVPSLRS